MTHGPESFLAAWALPDPWRVAPLAQGSNNLVWRIETPEGDYALTVYSAHIDALRLSFVRDVLVGVQGAGLPFAVPAPLPTRTGASFAQIAPTLAAPDGAACPSPAVRERDGGAGETVAGEATTEAATVTDAADGATLATLAALIPGEHPRRDDLAQAVAGGEALGRLDRALAAPPTPAAGVSWRSYGDLAHCHPLVPDPLAALSALPIADDARLTLRQHCADLMARIPALYASLPQQLCHEDFTPDNLLMLGPCVTGVLDFEFCARDVRVMDLTVALSWWPIAQFGSGDEWPIIRAIAQGYARQITLTPAEIAAIPTLFQLRASTSLIHRLGRYRQGISPLAAVTDRAEAALAREDWLATNADRLCETVADAAVAG